jgi:hypothetical protein
MASNGRPWNELRTEVEDGNLFRALIALQGFLDEQLTRAIDEVAHYPTPIARCDVQLTKLLDERGELIVRLDAIRAVLEALQSQRSNADTLLDELIRRYPAPEDAAEARFVADVMVARGELMQVR